MIQYKFYIDKGVELYEIVYFDWLFFTSFVLYSNGDNAD